jgi:hypothetical protein
VKDFVAIHGMTLMYPRVDIIAVDIENVRAKGI